MLTAPDRRPGAIIMHELLPAEPIARIDHILKIVIRIIRSYVRVHSTDLKSSRKENSPEPDQAHCLAYAALIDDRIPSSSTTDR